MASAAAKYQQAKAKLSAAKKEMEKIAKDAFQEVSAEFFEDNPTIQSFGWTQYTPYWNDGDTCTFSANTDYPSVTFTAKDGKVLKYDENAGSLTEAGTSVKDEDVEYSEDDEIDTTPYTKEISKYTEAVSQFLGTFEESDLETMFGDHMEITVPRKGKVKVEEHEHE